MAPFQLHKNKYIVMYCCSLCLLRCRREYKPTNQVCSSEHTWDWEVTGKCTKDLHILLCCPHLPSPPAHQRLMSLSAGLHTGHIRQRPSWYQDWQCVDSYRSFNVSSLAASARGRKRHHLWRAADCGVTQRRQKSWHHMTQDFFLPESFNCSLPLSEKFSVVVQLIL